MIMPSKSNNNIRIDKNQSKTSIFCWIARAKSDVSEIKASETNCSESSRIKKEQGTFRRNFLLFIG